MKEKTVAVIVLNPESTSSFANFDDTLREAAHWVEFAAAQGADLAVLPETINLLHRSSATATLEDLAIENWPQETALLCEAAARCGISLILPLLVRENALLANRFYVLSKDGSSLGYYQKRMPM